jgi:glycogen operon protein
MINAHWEDSTFAVQEGQPNQWRRVVDTAQDSPADIVAPASEPTRNTPDYLVQARSVVVLQREFGN